MTAKIADHARSVANRLETVLSTAAKNRKSFEDNSFPDVKELVDFNKSCNEGLSDKVAKLIKAKPAEQVKLAKEIREITARYAKNLQKMTGDFSLKMATGYLAPALEDMQKVCKTVVDKSSLESKDVEVLKKAKERWSKNKDESVVEAKKQEAITMGSSKSSLKDMDQDLKTLKLENYKKLLALLGKLDALPESQRLQMGRTALPHVKQMVDDVEKFAVTGTAGSLLAAETEQLDLAVKKMARELTVLLLPPAMELMASAANTGLRKGA